MTIERKGKEMGSSQNADHADCRLGAECMELYFSCLLLLYLLNQQLDVENVQCGLWINNKH